MRVFPVFLVVLLLGSCGLDSGARQSKIYPAGEKATVGQLTYAIIDTQFAPHLSGEGALPRIPEHRFLLIQIAVSNGGNADMPIPALSLVDDSGKAYPELPDGGGVQHWLGVVRRVGPGQTERGHVLFDAPASHMKLKLTDDGDESDIFIDVPLSFAHEQMEGNTLPSAAPATPAVPVQTQKK